MGTRADFYNSENGDAATAVWLGSIAWDGYPAGIDGLKESMAEEEWAALLVKLAERKDWTAPELGWPWPWNDSQTTDFAYVRDKTGKVAAYCFGRPRPFERADHDGDEEEEEPDKVAFPDMSGQKKVTLGPRSGLIVLGG
jgi:hypothetical protein